MCETLGIVSNKNQDDLGLLEVLSSSLAFWGGFFPFLPLPERATPNLLPEVPELSLTELSPLWGCPWSLLCSMPSSRPFPSPGLHPSALCPMATPALPRPPLRRSVPAGGAGRRGRDPPGAAAGGLGGGAGAAAAGGRAQGLPPGPAAGGQRGRVARSPRQDVLEEPGAAAGAGGRRGRGGASGA